MQNETASDRAIEKLTDNVEQLIQAAKKVAPQAWDAAVRQVVLVNALQLAAWVVTVIVAYVLIRLAIRMYKIDTGERYSRSDGLDAANTAVAILGGCAAIGALMMALIGGPATVAALLNPEFVAAEQLLWVLK